MKLSLMICVLIYNFACSKSDRTSHNNTHCDVEPKGGVEWIILAMQQDFGWKENTHRACIILAVNGWKGIDVTVKSQIELQLEIELTKALNRNLTSRIHENDLALYIHALIATEKDPRDFHGIDLVSDLLYRVNFRIDLQHRKSYRVRIHPFLVLTLCNCQAAELRHFEQITYYTQKGTDTRQDIEIKALSLKALACVTKSLLDNDVIQRFDEAIVLFRESLLGKQLEDGSFGNPYTTALIVQALIASNTTWENESRALEYLEGQSVIEVNMLKTYYIQMALNARKVKFIKDLSSSVKIERITSIPKVPEHETQFLTYSVILDPGLYHTITLKAPASSTFFDVMKTSAMENEKFKFTTYLNKNKEPIVYSVAGKLNDAEENMFWRLCVYDNNGNGIGRGMTYPLSPAKLHIRGFNEFRYWYRNADCPMMLSSNYSSASNGLI